MCIVLMHAGPIRNSYYGCASVWEIIHSLKIINYLPIHTHKQYNNFTYQNHKLNKIPYAPLSDIHMFYIKYRTMYKVCKHAGAVRKFLYDCTSVRDIIHSLKFVDYLLIDTHKPYNSFKYQNYKIINKKSSK